MRPHGLPPMPTDLRAEISDLMDRDGVHLIYNVPIPPSETPSWTQEFEFKLGDRITVTFVLFTSHGKEFLVCVDDDGGKGQVWIGTRNEGKASYSSAYRSTPEAENYVAVGPNQYITAHANGKRLAHRHDYTVTDYDSVVFYGKDKNLASIVSIHVTGERNYVDKILQNKLPPSPMFQLVVGSVMTIVGIFTGSAGGKIKLDVNQRGEPSNKMQLELDPGTIDQNDKVVQIRFHCGMVIAEGPVGSDVKRGKFPARVNCRVELVENFNVKRVTVESNEYVDKNLKDW